jgi:2-phosphosulfolactate phosphatase
MPEVWVHLLPAEVSAGSLRGGVAVVVDVLRASTTMIHALAAGCREIRPCATVREARQLAATFPPGQVLLGGERGGRPLPGFDLGNSPAEYTPERCRDRILILTTSNGTRALLHAQQAAEVLLAGFVNLHAVCACLAHERRCLHVLCAGTEGEVALEDVLLAGALVEELCRRGAVRGNDSARLAQAAYAQERHRLRAALEDSQGGRILRRLGYDEDIRAAARIDAVPVVPHMRRAPLRLVARRTGCGPMAS